MERRVDVAVHSHKDLTVESVPGLTVAAIPKRGPVAERLLIRPEAHDARALLLPLRHGARVGTGAPRRREQLLALRPDLELLDLRGNVPTRVERLREGRFDAIVLAEAGLVRLQLDTRDLVDFPLKPEGLVPAPAQGALAVQTRAEDAPLIELLERLLDCGETRRSVQAERQLLARAGGGCNLPLGALVERGPGTKGFRAFVFLGRDLPTRGCSARWAAAHAATPAAAVEAAYAQLESGAPTHAGPLSGRRIAITGARSGGTRLGERLVTLGAAVLHERVLGLEDVEQYELEARLTSLQPGDWIALTSREAAARLTGYFTGQRWPNGVRLAVVGESTAQPLREAGCSVDLVGAGAARELASAIIEASAGSARRPEVVFPCAQDALDVLPAALGEAGLTVTRVALYRTRPLPQVSLDDSIDARVYMSPSSVQAALDWERSHAGAHSLRLALGASTARALETHGLQASAIGDGTPESLVGALVRALVSTEEVRS